MKNKRISLCGLDCAQCPAFIATQNNDDVLRKKTAEKWAKEFNYPGIKPEDINCLGCLSLKEPLFSHCHECGVRRCGLDKGVSNCGECQQYNKCDKISSLHQKITEGKEICDEIRENRGKLR